MMLKSTKVEIKKEHQVLMIDKTTSFKKRAKGKKRELQVEWRASCHSREESKAGPKPETECLHFKGNVHWKRRCPEYLVDKKDGKVNKGIFDIQVIDVYLTSVYSSP